MGIERGSVATAHRPGFYASGLGDRLVDENRYSASIRRFLSAEKELLEVARASFEMLVEVGCMDGRYLRWAVACEKSYLGVEPVARYAAAARRSIARFGDDRSRYRAIRGSAESLDTLLGAETTGKKPALVFFPFNSFGNARDPWPILRALGNIGHPVLISSYRTTALATRSRQRYYERCAYRHLRKEASSQGIRFVTDEGLNSMAYEPEFLCALAADAGLDLAPIRFGGIGLAFVSSTAALPAPTSSTAMRG